MLNPVANVKESILLTTRDTTYGRSTRPAVGGEKTPRQPSGGNSPLPTSGHRLGLSCSKDAINLNLESRPCPTTNSITGPCLSAVNSCGQCSHTPARPG